MSDETKTSPVEETGAPTPAATESIAETTTADSATTVTETVDLGAPIVDAKPPVEEVPAKVEPPASVLNPPAASKGGKKNTTKKAEAKVEEQAEEGPVDPVRSVDYYLNSVHGQAKLDLIHKFELLIKEHKSRM